jgi:hypothetical protein
LGTWAYPIGTKPICHFYDGTSATELVTDWIEGESFRVELSDFSMPLVTQADARMLVTADGPQRSSVTITMEFKVKGGSPGLAVAELVMRPMMQSMFKRVLDGLDLHVRTSPRIGKDGKAVAAATAQRRDHHIVRRLARLVSAIGDLGKVDLGR